MMLIRNKILSVVVWLVLTCFVITNHALATTNDKFKYPFYVGVTGGYGSTTWEGLVPPKDKQNSAINISTPKYVTEGGALWGVFAGYELLPCFALEAAYNHYPHAKISFDDMSIFTFEHDGITEFTTQTESASLMAKIMLIIPKTDIRAYSSLGVAGTHRYDEINNHWTTSPTFGAGFNYNFIDHIMGELGANFTVGDGKSELKPEKDYTPFLYSVFLRLAYRF